MGRCWLTGYPAKCSDSFSILPVSFLRLWRCCCFGTCPARICKPGADRRPTRCCCCPPAIRRTLYTHPGADFSTTLPCSCESLVRSKTPPRRAKPTQAATGKARVITRRRHHRLADQITTAIRSITARSELMSSSRSSSTSSNSLYNQGKRIAPL